MLIFSNFNIINTDSHVPSPLVSFKSMTSFCLLLCDCACVCVCSLPHKYQLLSLCNAICMYVLKDEHLVLNI